nr:tyrosinase [Danio rerio]
MSLHLLLFFFLQLFSSSLQQFPRVRSPPVQTLLSSLARRRLRVRRPVRSRVLSGHLGVRPSQRAAVSSLRSGRSRAMAFSVLQPNLPVRRKLHGV